jgi:hypothetical protein
VESVEDERWVPHEIRLPLTMRATLASLRSEKAARTDAVARGTTDAGVLCDGLKADGSRLVSATAEAQSWRCSPRDSGWVCGFDGQAICQVQARHSTQHEVCK